MTGFTLFCTLLTIIRAQVVDNKDDSYTGNYYRYAYQDTQDAKRGRLSGLKSTILRRFVLKCIRRHVHPCGKSHDNTLYCVFYEEKIQLLQPALSRTWTSEILEGYKLVVYYTSVKGLLESNL